MVAQFAEIQKSLDTLHSLMDNSAGAMAPILRKAARVAGSVGDNEHRDLFLLHLEGLLYSTSAGPRHAPWQDSNWQPRWDVRMALEADRIMPDGNVMAFPLEELEHHHRRLREQEFRARDRGDTKNELKYFDLVASCETILFSNPSTS